MSQLNERYNSSRAKTAECVAAAVKRKEDVSLSLCGFSVFPCIVCQLYSVVWMGPLLAPDRHCVNMCCSPYFLQLLTLSV